MLKHCQVLLRKITVPSMVSSENVKENMDNPPIDVILTGMKRRRQYKPEENSPVKVVKKRIVKVFSDNENEVSEDLDYKRKEKSDYELRKVKIHKEKVLSELSEYEVNGLSSYEQMIVKKRAERIAFLKSMEIDQIKEEFTEAVGNIKQVKKKTSTKSYNKVQYPVEPIRRSKRLANIDVDFSEKSLEKLSIKNSFQASQLDYVDYVPPELTFEEALKSSDPYQNCVRDLSVKESNSIEKFVSYDKDVLKNMSLYESNVCKVVPSRITSQSWYPSKDDLIIAAGDKYGYLGLWKIQDSESTPYLFKVHSSNIPNMQFCLFNPVHLITASYDGTMRCCDLVKHTFNEIYDASDGTRCTSFDFLSPSTFLVSHSNGQVALVDRKTEKKSSEKRHVCHDYSIKTVSVHPVNKNAFITADNKKTVRLWDLRKLQSKPVVEINHHKRCVNSAYFSPVTGNSILTTSLDDSICIFDSTNLTGNMKLKSMIKHNNFTGRWLTIFKATWLPNSDDLFAVGSMDQPRRIEIFDKDLNLYHNVVNDNLTTVTSVHRFHPYRAALAGGNSSGKVFVFT